MSDIPRPIADLRKRLTVFDLFSGGQDELREIIQEATDREQVPDLFGPLYTITHELVVNALKAVYKKVFFEKFIVEIGMDDINYEEWLMLFKSEIEAHNAENFARLVRQMGQGVEIGLRLMPAGLKILVANQGRPSEIEMSRIRQSLELALATEHLSSILDQMSGDDKREGASLGIPLIVMSLKKMGADPRRLRIRSWGEVTCAGFTIPREILEKYTVGEEIA